MAETAPGEVAEMDFGKLGTLIGATTGKRRTVWALVIERHRHASFVLTSNRAVDEWLGLFDDPILGNSALDRLANAAHQLVLDGPSYRARLAPGHRRGGGQPMTATRQHPRALRFA